MNYTETLQYLYERLPMFQRQGAVAFKKDLTNTLRLLDHLGNPHQSFRSIHIAGTNGKGSSAHALSAILQTAGYKTGLYTSPHLKSFTERIRINGQEVSEEFVIEFVGQICPVIETIKPSFFEVTVAMAFEFFKDQKVDIAVIETGLGGRLDSTNVITPLVSLITMIGKDHAEMLGDTLEKIAGEKAGIIKQKVPVVIGADQPELIHVFTETARAKQAPLHQSQDIVVTVQERHKDSQLLSIVDRQGAITLLTDNTASYFTKNLSGILKTVQVLNEIGVTISTDAIADGLKNIKGLTGLKGRWQVLSESPLVVADVSHNEPGLVALFNQVEEIEFRALHLVIGMVKDKDLEAVLSLFPKNANYYFTQSSVPRSLEANALKEKAESFGLVGQAFTDVNRAIESAKKNAQSDDLILVCGSTFVVAEIEEL